MTLYSGLRKIRKTARRLHEFRKNVEFATSRTERPLTVANIR